MYICKKCLHEIKQPNWPIFNVFYDNKTCNRCKLAYVNCVDIHIDYVLGLRNVTMENKERTLKISLEQARKIWKERSDCSGGMEISAALNAIHGLLLENFTREELEDKKGYTWEESFKPGYSFIINEEGKASILTCSIKEPIEKCKFQFRREKQALSALAFAQLSHIVFHYNKGKSFLKGPNCQYQYWFIDIIDDSSLGGPRLLNVIAQTNYVKSAARGLFFARNEDSLESMEFNKELWEQYLMIQ